MVNATAQPGIDLSTFHCMCLQCNETMENTEKVLILTCGCLFKKRCLESSHIRYSFKNKIVEWFNTSIPDEIGVYQCRNPECNITTTFTIEDLVENNRYDAVFQRVQATQTIPEFESKHFAFVPEKLVEIYKQIIKEQREGLWKGKNWEQFKADIREIKNRVGTGNEWQDDARKLAAKLQLKKKTEEEWLKRVDENLIRIPAYPPVHWTCFKWIFYIGRAVYHGLLAIIWQLGLSFFKYFNFISPDTFNKWQENEVGFRLTELFLEYYGMHYNYARPETVENRVWSWIKREDRRHIEW